MDDDHDDDHCDHEGQHQPHHTDTWHLPKVGHLFLKPLVTHNKGAWLELLTCVCKWGYSWVWKGNWARRLLWNTLEVFLDIKSHILYDDLSNGHPFLWFIKWTSFQGGEICPHLICTKDLCPDFFSEGQIQKGQIQNTKGTITDQKGANADHKGDKYRPQRDKYRPK